LNAGGSALAAVVGVGAGHGSSCGALQIAVLTEP